MHKMFAAKTGTAIVLLTGLVSCSPEKKAVDVYQTPPPMIRTQAGAFDFKTWDVLKNPQLDLQDSLDFTANLPARIELRTRCRLGSSGFYARFRFAGENNIPIWRALPIDLLTENLAKKKFECGFEVNLFNEAGSNHIFALEAVPIVETSTPSVSLDHDSRIRTTGLMHLTPAQSQDVRLRYSHTGSATAQLICQDVELKLLPFDQVIDLAHFNFAEPLLKSERPDDVLNLRPVQLCRALIFRQEQRAAFGPLLQVTWPTQPLVVQQDPSPTQTQLSDIQLDQAISDFTQGKSVPIGIWHLHNSDSMSRYFRFAKGTHQVTARILMATNLKGPWLNISYLLNAVVVLPLNVSPLSQDASSLTVALGPNEDLTVEALFQSRSQMSCPVAVSTFKALTLNEFEPAIVEEVTGDGSPLTTLQFQPHTLSLKNPKPSPKIDANFRCTWN